MLIAPRRSERPAVKDFLLDVGTGLLAAAGLLAVAASVWLAVADLFAAFRAGGF